MSEINISHLTFYYDGSYETIFEDVTFAMDSRWKLGFIGRNGRGKTTFLRLLQGLYEYKGNIHASVDFEYYPYFVEDKSKNAIEIFENICPTAALWELERELGLLNIPSEVLYRPYLTLSNGEQTKILLAALFLKENAFLLIDEPTNHLDQEGREIVSEYLKGKRGYILVSHDRTFLDGCVDHILSINKTNIQVQKGNFSNWWDNKERQDQFEIEENQRLTGEINKLKAGARQNAQWSRQIENKKIGFSPLHREKNIGTRSYLGEKSRKVMSVSKNLERRQNKAIEDKSKLMKNIEKNESLKLNSLKYFKTNLISVNNLSVFFGNTPIFDSISFDVNQGDRIWLSGKNGSGKTSILKLLHSEPIPYQGEIRIGNQLKISYVSQDTSYLNGSLSAFIMEHELNETLFKTNLRKLDFYAKDFDKKLETYSEGQKKKVLIAKSLSEEAHLLLWDEPLNFIDIYSRNQLEDLLLSYKPTIVFVEHDAHFAKTISTKIIQL